MLTQAPASTTLVASFALTALFGLSCACDGDDGPAAGLGQDTSSLPAARLADPTADPAHHEGSERPDLAASSATTQDPFAREDLSALRPEGVADWPTESVHITSHFGWRVDPITGAGSRLHRGIDLRGKTGDLVLSVADGAVRFVGHDDLLGELVIIDHGQGVESYYGHLSALLVHEGLPVRRGSAIGLVGNSGRSEAPHLHLTIKIGGVEVDPLIVLGHPIHRLAAHTVRLPEKPDIRSSDPAP